MLSKLADSLVSFKKGSITGKSAFEKHIKAEIVDLATTNAEEQKIDFIAAYQLVLSQKWKDADQDLWAKKAVELEYDVDEFVHLHMLSKSALTLHRNQKQLHWLLHEALRAIAVGGALGDVEFLLFYGVRDTKGIRDSGL